MELLAAIDNDAVDAVKLLAGGASVNAMDREGMTALMHAALDGNPELTECCSQGRSGKYD